MGSAAKSQGQEEEVETCKQKEIEKKRIKAERRKREKQEVLEVT